MAYSYDVSPINNMVAVSEVEFKDDSGKIIRMPQGASRPNVVKVVAIAPDETRLAVGDVVVIGPYTNLIYVAHTLDVGFVHSNEVIAVLKDFKEI